MNPGSGACPNNSITAANLLNGAEKSYGGGKFLRIITKFVSNLLVRRVRSVLTMPMR